MSTVKDESVLVRRAMDGDREAFSDLAAAHWRRLVALARSIVADLEAEDVAQDGLIKATELGGFGIDMQRIVITR